MSSKDLIHWFKKVRDYAYLVDIASLPRVPMRYSPLLCLQFLKYEGEHDASLLGLIINGAGNIVLRVDASTTIDTLFLLIPDKYAHSGASFAFAVSLYTNLLPVGIRLLVWPFRYLQRQQPPRLPGRIPFSSHACQRYC